MTSFVYTSSQCALFLHSLSTELLRLDSFLENAQIGNIYVGLGRVNSRPAKSLNFFIIFFVELIEPIGDDNCILC